MSNTVRVEAEIDAATDSLLDSHAAARGRSKAELIGEAVQRYLDYERGFREEVRAGLAEADAGETVPHEAVVAELESRHRQRR